MGRSRKTAGNKGFHTWDPRPDQLALETFKQLSRLAFSAAPQVSRANCSWTEITRGVRKYTLVGLAVQRRVLCVEILMMDSWVCDPMKSRLNEFAKDSWVLFEVKVRVTYAGEEETHECDRNTLDEFRRGRFTWLTGVNFTLPVLTANLRGRIYVLRKAAPAHDLTCQYYRKLAPADEDLRQGNRCFALDMEGECIAQVFYFTGPFQYIAAQRVSRVWENYENAKLQAESATQDLAEWQLGRMSAVDAARYEKALDLPESKD